MSQPAQEFRKNHGIPERTTASVSLWAHLLRRDPQGQPPNSTSGLATPPITPLDKNGTSMRILLHDTQAHLDRFSENADKLANDIDEARREISIVKTLFQREHESLTEEMVDLVNRTQSQLQQSIGAPAQSEQLDRLSKDVSMHLGTLEKRLDAIQCLNQAHSQILQVQSQAIQSLQDQNGKILSALLPLLPLLQAIPLHVESSRNKITDLLLMKPLVHHPAQTMMPPSQSSTGSDATNSTRKGKRSGSTLSSDRSSPPSHRKRARETPTGDENKSLKLKRMVSTAHPKQMEFGSSLLGESIPPTVTPLKDARQDTIPVPSPRVSESPVYQSSAYEINVHTSTPQSIFKPVAPSKRLSSSGPNNGMRLRPSSCRPTHPPFAPMFSPACATSSPDRTEPRFTSHTLTHRPWSGQMPPQERTPCHIQEISTVSNTTSTSPQTHATIAFHPIRFSPINSNRFPPVLLGATHDAAQLSTEQHLNSGFQRSPLTPLRQHGTSPVSGFEPSPVQLPLQARLNPILYDETSRKPSDLSFRTKSSPGIAPQSKNRERRSPPKEGRRFIPLDDSDDDDDAGIDGNED